MCFSSQMALAHTRLNTSFSEKSVDATLRAIKQFIALAEKQTSKKVKCFHMDMGKEFLNSELEGYCKEQGICIKTPALYIHSGNSVSERTNYTILEGMQCVQYNSGLPPSYWADIIAATIYVYNLMPSQQHQGQIPAKQ